MQMCQHGGRRRPPCAPVRSSRREQQQQQQQLGQRKRGLCRSLSAAPTAAAVAVPLISFTATANPAAAANAHADESLVEQKQEDRKKTFEKGADSEAAKSGRADVNVAVRKAAKSEHLDMKRAEAANLGEEFSSTAASSRLGLKAIFWQQEQQLRTRCTYAATVTKTMMRMTS